MCTRQFCSYVACAEDLPGIDAVIVGISSEDVASHTAFASRRGIPVPLLADRGGKVAKAYGAHAPVVGTRRAVVAIDEDGIVRHRHVHRLGLDFQTVDELREVLAELDGASAR